jgi:hypothetical protein
MAVISEGGERNEEERTYQIDLFMNGLHVLALLLWRGSCAQTCNGHEEDTLIIAHA